MRGSVSRFMLAASCAMSLALVACGGRGNGNLPDFADLVQQVSPSVVNISAVPANPEPPEQTSDESQNNKLPDWLRKFLEQHGQGQQPPAKGDPGEGKTPGDADASPDSPDGADGDDGTQGNEQSLGSGFILSEDGYVLTNHHVVKDSKEVVVTLSDRRQLPATVVGSDERSDIALLKIDASGLPAVKIADIKKIRVGEWVVAIGSPFGFDYTVTSGIVSAKGRNLDTEQYVPFIQTDAAINPGNSGGPLFNMRGEVIGVNSQIYSQTGGFMGVAFSIPIDVATKVARELKEKGKVTRGWLGVVVQKIDRNLATSFGMSKPGGALVARVLPDSPAQQSGVKAGDVILKFNGIELATSSELPPLVGNSTPGDSVTLDLLRDGKEITVKLEVGSLENQDQDQEQPAQSPVPPNTPPRGLGDSAKPLGLSIKSLSDDERKSARIVSGGVKVAGVAPGPARDAGVLSGDVILSIAGQDVESVDRYNEVIGRLTPGQTVPMLVQRDGAPLFLALQVPPKP
ncbi:MAG: DegQ family serine endoprotease [Nevskia sp.]|nr:DegQ family serine endoprotease [Nevskia sp.]